MDKKQVNIAKVAKEVLNNSNEIENVERVMPPNQDWLRALLKDGTEILLSWIHNHWEWHGDKKINENIAEKIINFAREKKVLTNPLMSQFASKQAEKKL